MAIFCFRFSDALYFCFIFAVLLLLLVYFNVFKDSMY